ncbi:MAG: hypothetical protein SVR81_01650 [Chloroflexota bacterium]|nr:hypothetical protein [Chloroflexota bacterium]
MKLAASNHISVDLALGGGVNPVVLVISGIADFAQQTAAIRKNPS